jgi:hypothetical protein
MEEEVGVYDGIKVEAPAGYDEKNGEEEVLSEVVASDDEQQQVEGEGALSGSSSDEEDVDDEDSSEGALANEQGVELPAADSGLPPAPLPVSPVTTSTFVPDFNKALKNSARFAHRREPCAFPRLRELQRTHPEVIELALLVDEVRISNKGTDALL